jgi:hypothetical protein
MKEVKKKGRKEVQEGKKEGTEKGLAWQSSSSTLHEGRKEGGEGLEGRGRLEGIVVAVPITRFPSVAPPEATSALPSVTFFLAWLIIRVPIFKFWFGRK